MKLQKRSDRHEETDSVEKSGCDVGWQLQTHGACKHTYGKSLCLLVSYNGV